MTDDRAKEEIAAEIERLQRLQGEIRRLSSAKFVELEALAELFTWLDEQRSLRGTGCVIGRSQTGKTVACRVYALRNRPRTAKGDAIAVLHLRLPPACSARTLYGHLLERLDGPIPPSTSLDALRQATLDALSDRGVRLLLADNATAQSLRLLQELRYLAEVGNLAVTLIGTPKLTSLLAKDGELAHLFQPRHWLAPLQGEAFVQAVDRWETEVLKLPEPSDLSRREVLPTLMEASDGRIGHLDRILRRAAIRALRQGLRTLDQATLETVVQDYRSGRD
ncbi:MAG: hypothetical protein Fur0042_06280 [Cyanophyceae cyanobacterium]